MGANGSPIEDLAPPPSLRIYKLVCHPPKIFNTHFLHRFLTKFLNETLQVDEHQWEGWSDLRWQVSLVPRPPMFLLSICIHNNIQNRKTSEKLHGKAWEHSLRA